MCYGMFFKMPGNIVEDILNMLSLKIKHPLRESLRSKAKSNNLTNSWARACTHTHTNKTLDCPWWVWFVGSCLRGDVVRSRSSTYSRRGCVLLFLIHFEVDLSMLHSTYVTSKGHNHLTRNDQKWHPEHTIITSRKRESYTTSQSNMKYP